MQDRQTTLPSLLQVQSGSWDPITAFEKLRNLRWAFGHSNRSRSCFHLFGWNSLTIRSSQSGSLSLGWEPSLWTPFCPFLIRVQAKSHQTWALAYACPSQKKFSIHDGHIIFYCLRILIKALFVPAQCAQILRNKLKKVCVYSNFLWLPSGCLIMLILSTIYLESLLILDLLAAT